MCISLSRFTLGESISLENVCIYRNVYCVGTFVCPRAHLSEWVNIVLLELVFWVNVCVLTKICMLYSFSHRPQQHIGINLYTAYTHYTCSAMREQCKRVGVRLYPLRGCVSVTVCVFAKNVVGSVCANLSV